MEATGTCHYCSVQSQCGKYSVKMALKPLPAMAEKGSHLKLWTVFSATTWYFSVKFYILLCCFSDAVLLSFGTNVSAHENC